MCQEIDLYHKSNPDVKILPFSQIKFKFGRIKIYMSLNKNKYIDALISLTASLINNKSKKIN